MGRLNGNTPSKNEKKKMDALKAKRNTPSGSHLRKSNYYKGNFQKSLGNAKTGRGYTLVQKKRLLSRFKKKMMRRKSRHEESTSSTNKSLCINPNQTEILDEVTEDSTLQESRDNDSTLHASTFSLFKRKKKTKKETNVKRVEIDYNAIQEERRKKAAELQASLAEHEEMVTRNIRMRKNVTKRLSQRTKRGQPIMANRLELMLDKIKKNDEK